MALTQTATLPPSWDETIVPTLRKRLQSESQVIAERMSVASIGSDDGLHPYQYSNPHNNITTNMFTPYSPQQQTPRPSGIPRPSTQQSRPSFGLARPVDPRSKLGQGQPNPSSQRKRTLSQPFLFDQNKASSASRSTSPTSPTSPSAIMTTRIPMKSRNGSVSSSAQGHQLLNGQKSHYVLESPIDSIRPKQPMMLDEPAPFPKSNGNYLDTDRDSARFSSESEERPFEHWYRGDVSRNGGVGELRVARRKEMLDIANYGHAAKQAANNSWRRSRSNSRTGEFDDTPVRRRRADSIGLTGRESFYLDEEREQEMVLDERPLTDTEDGDQSLEPEEDDMRMSYYFDDGRPSQSPSPPPVPQEPTRSSGSTSIPRGSTSRSQTPTSSRIPIASPRTPTPTGLPRVMRSVTEPLPLTSQPSTSVYSQTSGNASDMARSRSETPTRANTSQATPRKAKSPGPSSSNYKKNPKSPKGPSSFKKPVDDEKERRSVAVYPALAGDENMENAVPTWTQPVRKSNWDEMVLPVVARKKGLDELYEVTDGTPRRPKPEERMTEPAPGTFGYDHTKYRAPHPDDGDNPEDIQLDVFGNPKEVQPEQPAVDDEPTPMQSPQIPDDRPIKPMPESQQQPPLSPQASFQHVPPSRSPAPFSHYDPNSQPTLQPHQLEAYRQQQDHPPEDDKDSGCCKCVIM